MKSPLGPLVLSLFVAFGLLAAPKNVACLAPPGLPAGDASLTATQTLIPGPLRSFQRMAGISSKAAPEEILTLLAHEMNTRGYVGTRPSEYLIQLRLYLQQARDLATFAGPEGVIRISGCKDCSATSFASAAVRARRCR